jgi:hypothetical protein
MKDIIIFRSAFLVGLLLFYILAAVVAIGSIPFTLYYALFQASPPK